VGIRWIGEGGGQENVMFDGNIYSIETAIKGVSSFMRTQGSFAVGQPVLCVISEISPNSRRIFLTPHRCMVGADDGAAFKDVKDWKSISLEHVRPDIPSSSFPLLSIS
jgi:hypothetical protein